MMDVSVVIPFFSNVEWLYEAVNSINEPADFQFQIIIINDGSNERIDFNRFNENRNKITYIQQQNQGPGKARNVGISVARGEYIAFLDSDDIFIKDKLIKQLNFMRSNEYIWSHTSYINFFPNGKEKTINVGEFYDQVFPICLAYNPIATPTVMVKKDVLNVFPTPFSEEMRYGQDGYLWFRLAEKFPLGVIDEPLAKVRISGKNTYLRAYNHLYVKAKMYSVISSKTILKDDQIVPGFLHFLYMLSAQCYHFVDNKLSRYFNKEIIEFISRIVYFPIYVLLKVFYRLEKLNKQ